MLTWKYIGGLNIKGKHNFKHFLLYNYCRNTHQKEHSCRYTELSLYRKAGIATVSLYVVTFYNLFTDRLYM